MNVKYLTKYHTLFSTFIPSWSFYPNETPAIPDEKTPDKKQNIQPVEEQKKNNRNITIDNKEALGKEAKEREIKRKRRKNFTT